MRDLLLTLAVALVLGLVVFGAVAFTLGKASGLEPAAPDAAPHDLPQDGPVAAGDLKAVRFDVVLRGYRMDQVDGVLERVGYELEMRDEEVRALRAELGLLDGDGEEPTGAHAARSGPAEVGTFALGVQVSRNHTSAGAANDDTAILGDPALIHEAAVVAALGDTADEDTSDVRASDEDAPDRELSDDGPRDDGPAAGRPLASDDTAVLDDLLGNERHPR